MVTHHEGSFKDLSWKIKSSKLYGHINLSVRVMEVHDFCLYRLLKSSLHQQLMISIMPKQDPC